MSEPRLVDPRPTGAPVGGPPDNEALPDDLALEAAGRLRAACLVLGSLWTVLLVVNHLVAPYLGLPQGQVIPWPPVANVLALGCNVDLQVTFDGIGRVDMVVDGWLVVECDSRAFHAGWKQQLNDRRRDAALAALGFVTLRLTAEDIMYNPEFVLAAVKGLLASRMARLAVP